MRALFAEVDMDASFLRSILGMQDPFHYRNKVASPFAPGKASPGKGTGGSGKALTNKAGDGKYEANKVAAGKAGRAQSGSKGSSEILTGMYAAGTHKLVDTQGCAVENADANAVVQAVKRIMRKYGMTPYNEDTGAGFMRHVVVRVGHTSGEMLVVLVTNGVEFTGAKNFCRELVKACPKVTTVVQNINLRQTNVILGEESRTLYGPGFILDSLCGVSFRISPTSFYQVNAVQTEVLYRMAIEAAGLTGKETVIDAYCGTGTIGLVAAAGLPADGARTPGAKRVIGVDNVPDAIRDAVQNAKHNGITRAEFVCTDATEFLKELAHKGKTNGVSLADGEPLVLLMDPPRAGSTPEFLDAAAALSPERIVYISCNPQTQVRDIRQLQESGYRVEIVQPVDMFPHTPHVETVALLSKS